MFYYNLLAAFVLFYCLSLAQSYPTCNEDFLVAARRLMNPTYCRSEILGAEFGWKYDNVSRRLDILFGARLDDYGMSWLAWGLNPGKEPRMVGTRALIGIKNIRNGSLTYDTYNINEGTKRDCGLQPSRIDLNVSNFDFLYMEQINYYTIQATIILPHEYNESRINIVWQVGKMASDVQPRMHPKTIQNFDSTQTIDLLSGKTQTLQAHSRHRLRKAHGLLNIVGWGTFLPIGVIISRYFKKFPIDSPWWFRLHVSCQIVGWSVGTIGWIIGILLGRYSKYYSFPIHGTVGIFIFTFATLQMFALRLKPDRRDEYRQYWNMYHHFLGYSLLATICVNIFKGIKILHAEDEWKWGYVGELTFLGCIFLALEIYNWKRFWDKEKNKENNPNKKNGKVTTST